MWPRAMQNMTRAVRLPERLLRTSHSPCPRGRQTGIPTGHPYSAVAMSCPISRRSSGGRAFSQSRTGSVPAGVGSAGLGGYSQSHAGLLLERAHNTEEVLRARVTARRQHPMQALARLVQLSG